MANDNLPTRKEGNRDLINSSWIERITGKYTNTIAVLFIFISTLAVLVSYLIFASTYNDTVVTGLFSILTTTIGYFLGKAGETNK